MVWFKSKIGFKGIVHPKWKFCHELLTLMSFQTLKTFVHLRNTIKIFLMKSESFLILHRQQWNCVVILSWKASKTETERKRINSWIKLLFLFSICTKKYSHSFIKWRLNHWCHMDYFTDVLATFLGLEHVSCIVICRVRKLSDFIKNIVIYVSKINEGLTGLEWHEGE